MCKDKNNDDSDGHHNHSQTLCPALSRQDGIHLWDNPACEPEGAWRSGRQSQDLALLAPKPGHLTPGGPAHLFHPGRGMGSKGGPTAPEDLSIVSPPDSPGMVWINLSGAEKASDLHFLTCLKTQTPLRIR